MVSNHSIALSSLQRVTPFHLLGVDGRWLERRCLVVLSVACQGEAQWHWDPELREKLVETTWPAPKSSVQFPVRQIWWEPPGGSGKLLCCLHKIWGWTAVISNVQVWCNRSWNVPIPCVSWNEMRWKGVRSQEDECFRDASWCCSDDIFGLLLRWHQSRQRPGDLKPWCWTAKRSTGRTRGWMPIAAACHKCELSILNMIIQHHLTYLLSFCREGFGWSWYFRIKSPVFKRFEYVRQQMWIIAFRPTFLWFFSLVSGWSLETKRSVQSFCKAGPVPNSYDISGGCFNSRDARMLQLTQLTWTVISSLKKLSPLAWINFCATTNSSQFHYCI